MHRIRDTDEVKSICSVLQGKKFSRDINYSNNRKMTGKRNLIELRTKVLCALVKTALKNKATAPICWE